MKRFGLAIALAAWTTACSDIVAPDPSESAGGCEYWEYDCVGTGYAFHPARFAIDLDGRFGALIVTDATRGQPLAVTIELPDAKPAPTSGGWVEDEGAWTFVIEIEDDQIEYRVTVAAEAYTKLGLGFINWCSFAGRTSVGIDPTFRGHAVPCRIWRADLLVVGEATRPG